MLQLTRGDAKVKTSMLGPKAKSHQKIACVL